MDAPDTPPEPVTAADAGGAGTAVTREVVVRAVLAGLAVAVLALGFILSYAGALHDPRPRAVPLAVAARVPEAVATSLDASSALRVERVADGATARRAIERRDAYGAVVTAGRGLEIIVAPAASPGIATLLSTVVADQLRQGGTSVAVTTVHALPQGDSRGLVSFYVVVGWAIAGYLGATMFGITFGTQIPRRRVLLRLGSLLGLGVVTGLGGALIARAVADVPGSIAGLGLLGTFVVLTAGAVTVALQSVLGVLGTGLAILLFVVLGNPSSGGPAAPELLPSPWHEIGQVIPVGAGVTAFRDAAYFPAASLATPLLTLLAWLVAGVAVALAFAARAPVTTESEIAASAIGAA